MAGDSHRTPGSTPESATDDDGRRAPPVAEGLLTVFAHELRNILGPVRTAAHLLRAGANEDAQAQWALDLIDRQVLAITALIDELADHAKLERGALALQSQPMDFRDVLDGAASACAGALSERRQTVKWERPTARMPVRGDHSRLVQAVGAVLRSTSGAAAAGARIAVRVEREGAEVVTTIGDQPATPPLGSTRPHADGDARATAQDGSAPLRRVGLSLAEAVIARHGGALVALDPSRFLIRLPLAGEPG